MAPNPKDAVQVQMAEMQAQIEHNRKQIEENKEATEHVAVKNLEQHAVLLWLSKMQLQLGPGGLFDEHWRASNKAFVDAFEMAYNSFQAGLEADRVQIQKQWDLLFTVLGSVAGIGLGWAQFAFKSHAVKWAQANFGETLKKETIEHFLGNAFEVTKTTVGIGLTRIKEKVAAPSVTAGQSPLAVLNTMLEYQDHVYRQINREVNEIVSSYLGTTSQGDRVSGRIVLKILQVWRETSGAKDFQTRYNDAEQMITALVELEFAGIAARYLNEMPILTKDDTLAMADKIERMMWAKWLLKKFELKSTGGYFDAVDHPSKWGRYHGPGIFKQGRHAVEKGESGMAFLSDEIEKKLIKLGVVFPYTENGGELVHQSFIRALPLDQRGFHGMENHIAIHNPREEDVWWHNGSVYGDQLTQIFDWAVGYVKSDMSKIHFLKPAKATKAEILRIQSSDSSAIAIASLTRSQLPRRSLARA